MDHTHNQLKRWTINRTTFENQNLWPSGSPSYAASHTTKHNITFLYKKPVVPVYLLHPAILSFCGLDNSAAILCTQSRSNKIGQIIDFREADFIDVSI